MLTGLFWEAKQQSQINQAGSNAAGAKNKADRIEIQMNVLSRKIDRISLASQALWELLRDNTDFKEEDILDKMQEIDLRDGKADNKIGHSPVTCSQCGRQGNSMRAVCVYCGSNFQREHVFE